jgi:L-lysine 2,3-aminomutase
MKLPKIKKGYDGETFEQTITRTFIHELDHCRGMKHGEMPDDRKRNISYLPADLIVGEKKAKVKVKKTADDKITVLLKRKKTWETKFKRANTALKKIAKQIKYYQKKQQNTVESV